MPSPRGRVPTGAPPFALAKSSTRYVGGALLAYRSGGHQRTAFSCEEVIDGRSCPARSEGAPRRKRNNTSPPRNAHASRQHVGAAGQRFDIQSKSGQPQ